MRVTMIRHEVDEVRNKVICTDSFHINVALLYIVRLYKMTSLYARNDAPLC